jgi:hypothetical protein
VLGSDVSQPAFVTAVLDCVFEAMRPDAREAAQSSSGRNSPSWIARLCD